ncbi:GNAT family N-acetyltransferase [Polyangium jinanense]|uniref:GNAT family N-acetyltransferase n=1 Tax=Polyangium jinanense TaxID=2829994 RepID=A0A9X3X2W9_9BACT|nr:GNAT family N-acetyltransferase [Polyangium jinanense]MDC3955489.1 GNAT family N-acetyltransferase [Polyangium jinanense]MDC3981790.1 GNAT family N-acetyltransferase [Polyangium jinanense]
MSFTPLTPSHVPLRGGRRALLRMATYPADSAGLLDLERAIVKARQGIVKYPDELPDDPTTYGDLQIRAGMAATDGSAFCMVAEEEGRGIVAEASILRLTLRMVRHVAVLGIGVHPDAQGIGLGRALLEALLGWVRDHRDADGGRIRRVELHVRADNPRAVALYRSLGFQEEGSRRGLIRRDDGNFVDDIGMGLLLPDPDEPSASA